MIELAAKTEEEAKIEVAELSKANIGSVVTVSATFGLFAHVSKGLNVFAPTDGPFKWYAKNGEIKTFTEAMEIADSKATPTMH